MSHSTREVNAHVQVVSWVEKAQGVSQVTRMNASQHILMRCVTHTHTHTRTHAHTLYTRQVVIGTEPL